MTVKELKEELDKFSDNLIVMMPNSWWAPGLPHFVRVGSISQGFNEFDGLLFINEEVSYEER